MTTRLYLDVDGVINVFPRRGTNPTGWSELVTGEAKGYRITWAPEMFDALNSLGLDLVWTTTWLDWAPTCLGPLTGFGENARHLSPVGGGGVTFPSIDWKWESVISDQLTSLSPFVWLDDELSDVHISWAAALGGLAIRTNETKGITPEIVESIREFVS